MKIILYIMVASSLLAADFLSINIKIMELSLFRISLLLLSIVTLLRYLRINKKIGLKIKNEQGIMITFYFFWFVYSLFSLGWVQDYVSWSKAIFYIGSGFLSIWLLSVYVKEERDFKRVLFIVFIMLILHNIIGWNELITGTYRFADLARIDRHGQFVYNPAVRRPVSMFGNTNDYATVLSIGIFLTYIVFSNSTSKVIKVLSAGTIASSVYLLLRTNSRANILGLIIGTAIFIYLKYFKRINIKTLLIIIFVSLLFLNPTVLNSILGIFSEKLCFTFDGGSDRTRLNLIKNGLYFLLKTFGFGTGAGNIEHWMVNYKIYYTGTIRNIHNWWMEILTGYGIIIFVGYVWIYFKMFKTLYSSYVKSNDKFIQNTSLGFISVMTAFIIGSMSSSSNIGTAWIWLLWGVVIAYIGYVQKHMELKKKDNNIFEKSKTGGS